jgi:hypothetical protein
MEYIYFPLNESIPENFNNLIEIFSSNHKIINSINDDNENRRNSDAVLKVLAPQLESVGYLVEKSKKSDDKIAFVYKDDTVSLTFEADAFHKEHKIAIEVEAGRAWDNKQFLKDIFEACLIDDIEYMVVAVRLLYRGRNDFDKVSSWLRAIYSSKKITLSFKGLLLIGY